MTRALDTVSLLGSALILAGTSYFLRPYDLEPPAHHVACRSALAQAEARLYVADQQACLNVGVLPVTKKGARR